MRCDASCVTLREWAHRIGTNKGDAKGAEKDSARATVSAMVRLTRQRVRAERWNAQSGSEWTKSHTALWLWTLYELDRMGLVVERERGEWLRWAQKEWELNGIEAIFNGQKEVGSFAEFVNALYRFNLLDAIVDEEEDADGLEMEMEEDVAMVDNIRGVEDADLFTVDLGDGGAR